MLLREPLPGMGPPPPRDDPLPASWRWVRLGDVCAVISGQSPPGDTYRSEPVGLPFFQGKADFGRLHPIPRVWCSAPVKIAEPDDVLLSVRAPVGPTNVADVRCCIGRGLAALRPSDQLDGAFLLWALRHLEGEIAKLGTGSTFAAITRADLLGLPFPYPPVAAQRRIAARLSAQLAAVDRARAAAEAQLAAAEALPAAYLRALFDSPESRRWPTRRLGDLLVLRKEVVHPRDKPTGHGVFVGLEHVESGTGVRIGSIDLDLSHLAGRKPRFYGGDIVYGYLRPYLNKVWVADFDGLCSVDQYVYQTRADIAEASFIAAFMRSPSYLERAPVTASPGQLPRIRTQEVAAVELHLPPLAEQRRLAAELARQRASSEALSAALRRQLGAIEELPASLLRQAFTGRH